jgi:hypothetical protein
MKKNLEKITDAWDARVGASIFTTVSGANTPNSIYVKSISKYSDTIFLIADNYFNKTRENVKSGCRGSILFMVSEAEAYQLKGIVKYETEGVYFDNMKSWNNPKRPGHAVAVLEIDAGYCGGERLF